MKKLLSICFLSIFLMMFSAQAQVDCCFSLSNPAADTLHEIANLPGGNLPLTHSMDRPVFRTTSTYDLVFSDANCLGIDYETGKVSIELELWCDGENVLDGHHNLASYCDITLKTTYNELNWLGAQMIGTNYPNVFEYPGAVQQFVGTYNISNVNFDYFFFKFLVNSQTKVMITWNQVFRDVQLIAHIRERVGGTNHEFYWDNQQRQNLGGHQSDPLGILASDTLSTAKYPTGNSVIKDCEPVTVGNPVYTMDSTGIYKIAYVDTTCGYRIDSVVTYDYTLYVHPTTPTLSDSTITYCQRVDATPITLPAEPNAALADHVADIVAHWSTDGATFAEAASFTPNTDVTFIGADTTLVYYVKRHDNVTGCESEVDTFRVKITPIPADPTVTDTLVEYCVGETAVALAYTAPAGQQVLWGTTVDNITSTTAPVPTTTAAGTTIYYLKLQDIATVNRCISDGYDSITVVVYANPVVSISADKNTLCIGDTAVMTANPTTLTTYQWKKDNVAITGATDTIYKYINNVTAVDTITFGLAVTEAHVAKSCSANATIEILAYPAIGTPTPVRGDTALCGPGSTTLQVNNGANGTTSTWYAKNKTTVLGTGTTYTQTFTVTDTLYVSSSNAFGCETSKDNWLPLVVTVNEVPTIVLNADNGGEVCAGENLIIRSTVTTALAPLTYAWSGTGLQAPLNKDSVTFNHNVAGTYTDTLKVTDAHNCFNSATIQITVDSLPIIILGVDVTVKNNEFCVGENGKITFNTEYVKYSINGGTSWQNHPANEFTALAAGTYNLKVVNGNGCINNPATVATIIKDTVNPTLAFTDSANTHCKTPFNGQLSVQATPAGTYTYKLNDGTAQNDSIFTALENGTYKVTAINMVTGCFTDSLNVVVANGKEEIVWDSTITANTHCTNLYTPYDGKVVINVNTPAPAAGAHEYYYEITAGVATRAMQTSNTFDTLQDGTYTVRVMDTITRCEKSKDVIVPIAIDTVKLAFDVVKNTHCTAPHGGKITVNVTPAAAAGQHAYKYEILAGPTTRPAQTSNVFDTLEHGLYLVKVTDTIKGCVGQDTIRVQYQGVLPTANISTPEFICFGDTTQISMVPVGASVFNEWTYVGPADATLINPIHDKQSFTLKNFPAGKHTFIAHFTDSITHCTNVVDTTIRVIGVNINLVTIPVGAHVCEYDSLKVFCLYYPDDTKDSIVEYHWYARHYSYVSATVIDTVWISPSASNNRVSLVVTDNHNCGNSKYIDLGVYALPDISLTGSLDYCKGSTANITASSTHTITEYKWDGVVGTANFSQAVVKDTNVVLTLKDDKGCVSDSTITINMIEVPGAPVFATPQKFCKAEDIHIDTTVQAAPTVGTFVWNTSSPNVVKAAGNYVAHYENTENSVTCSSDPDTVEVIVTGLPVSTIAMKYNSEASATTSHTRCYETTAKDSLKLTVTPTGSGTMTITYKLNGVDTASTMVITRTEPGTYNDTIIVKVTADNSGCVCEWSDTVYYALTINSLPTAPTDFPNVYNAGNPTIFYCKDSTLTYSFTAPASTTLLYDGLTTPSTTAGTHVLTVTRTDVTPNCSKTFNYEIVEVANPSVLVTSKDASKLCGDDTFNDTIIATITTSYPTSYLRLFTWNSESEKSKTVNADTMTHTISASDTVVVKVGVRADNGAYSATCYKNPYDSVKVVFQPRPDMPQLKPTADGYVTADSAAYCSTISITASDFTTSAGATVTIVGGTITTHGEYKVVANNNLPPACPSDTLILKVYEKRTPVEPTNIGTGKYDHKVYFCEGNTPVYEFEKANTNDEFLYSDGGDFVTTKPDTAGTYTLRVRDIVDSCYIDVNFEIIMVQTPNFTVTMKPAAQWTDKDICESSNHFNQDFYQSVSALYTRRPDVTGHAWRIWDGVDSVFDTYPYHHIYDFDVTKDTILTFTYSEYDTAGNLGYGVSCPFWWSDTIKLTFFATPAAPVYNGRTKFCAGDSIVVGVDSFTVATAGTELVSTPTLPQTYKADGGTITAYAQYTSFTSCKSANTVVNIVKNALPTVAIAPHGTTICKGDTAIFKVTGASTYVWSTGADIDSIFATDTIKYSVIGTDTNGCKNVDTVKLNFHPLFQVKLSHDTLVCIGESVDLTAKAIGTGVFDFAWYKDDETTSFDGATAVTEMTTHVTPPASAIVDGMPVPTLYKVEVTDEYGCTSSAEDNVIKVAADDRPQFEFRTIGGTESIRYMEALSGDQSAFEMYVKKNCWTTGEKVFVDFQIYKNGVPMTKAQLANTLDHYVGSYNTSYSFDLTHNAPAITYQSMESSNYDDASDFFPQSEFMDGTSYDYDWFWMHFLDGRKITVNLGAWKPNSGGVYTFHYAVVKAGPFASQNGSVYSGLLQIGGYGSHSSLSVKDTIAYDYFTIYVDSTYVGASDFNFVAPAVVTTAADEEAAPAKAMSMNVYPNPASNNVNVVLEGISGQTMITVHDMSGKAVSSMKVDVDENGQIFNLPVDNYSQGIYFIKAVNGSAVMTKKLIIAR